MHSFNHSRKGFLKLCLWRWGYVNKTQVTKHRFCFNEDMETWRTHIAKNNATGLDLLMFSNIILNIIYLNITDVKIGLISYSIFGI